MAEELTPTLVWFRGVCPAECEAVSMEEMLPPALRRLGAPTLRRERNHTVLPTDFTSVCAHLCDPTTPCWYCGSAVKGFAWFVPTSMKLNAQSEIVKMHVEGCYCGFVCAASDIERGTASEEIKNSRRKMLARLVEKVHGLDAGSVKFIFVAPDPRHKREEWGVGTMKQIEYRKLLTAMRDRTLASAR